MPTKREREFTKIGGVKHPWADKSVCDILVTGIDVT